MMINIDDILYDVRAGWTTEDMKGWIDYDERAIYVNQKADDIGQQICLAHEILHAFLQQAQLREDNSVIVEGKEEVLVRRLEKIFWRFLRDNGFDFDKYLLHE